MTVMKVLMPVAGLIKARFRGAKADIDSPFFKLHYRTTATIMFISCILVTCNDFFGSTINCISGTIPGNVMNTYCWIMSTFTVPSTNAVSHGKEYAHQGVQNYVPGETPKTFHAYYQWVPFILFLQGVLFYFPHYLWKVFEDRKLDKVTKNLRGRTLSLEQRSKECDGLIKYIEETFHTHNFYAFKYFLCDFINLINVILQMYMVNRFLGGVFMAYGTDVLAWSEADPETRTDPLQEVFPRITKCEFMIYGHSGTIEKHDAMCLLALNIINEKIFIFMWFWFIILAVVTSLYMLYVIAVISIPSMRQYMLERNSKNLHSDSDMNILTDKAEMGDWFLIFLLSRNLDSVLFNDFIVRLANRLKNKA
eukprot:TRINITY_DN1454_c0_g1_i1.p1 TRINITY_DN1454_c0_g1~~TRINITY_DN1454_c0_g1_i1.p1  ORF type:complete len:365 (-),score=98.56 TRINITY_DN1454_c0_g1_i1:1841-2935(-)